MTRDRKRKILCVAALSITWSIVGDIFATDDISPKPLFSFGVLADVQYADHENTGARHYREALGQLKECVSELNKQELAFTIQLGDIIDGNKVPERTRSDLELVLDEYEKLSMPKYHVV